MDLNTLQEIGLTEGESKVYVALLKLGPSTSGPIIEKAEVSRSIIYNILERLIEKGLVSHITKDKTKYYQAASPTQINNYLEEKEKALQKTKKKAQDLIPKLEEFKKYSKENIVQIYQGFKGVQSAHEHTYLKLNKDDEYFFLGIKSEQTKGFHLYWEKDHKKRVQRGINCKLLFNEGTPKEILESRNKFKGCESRYMPEGIKTPAWFLGYKDTTVIGIQSKEPIAIEIVNQEVADSFKTYFDEFWKKSKKI